MLRHDPEPTADTLHDTLDRLFQAHRIEEPGFVTGYYEPIVDGSPVQSPEFSAPVLPRPDDLVTLDPAVPAPGVPAGHAAARRHPDGGLEAYADRAEIEDHALRSGSRPLVWLRDWTELFLVQVQGSARVQLPDGSGRRLVYAGRNGHPYTSIGRTLIEEGQIPTEEMSLDRLKGWLRANGQDIGEKGRALMRRNRSYIFFRMVKGEDKLGPIGGAGVPLTPLRSIAVDRTLWPYGLPFFIETEDPVPGFGPTPLRRLFVAQDTGSAIVGRARADLFLGWGEAAGRAAGCIRHQARFTVLVPRAP